MDVGRGAEYDSHSRRVWDDNQAGDERRRYRDQPEYDTHSSRCVAYVHYTVYLYVIYLFMYLFISVVWKG